MRIFVVEDEPRLCELTTAHLRQEGYSVDSCQDGGDALDYLACAQYDLCIFDIMLPGRSGLELLRHLRAQGDTTPVLLLTALDRIGCRCGRLPRQTIRV